MFMCANVIRVVEFRGGGGSWCLMAHLTMIPPNKGAKSTALVMEAAGESKPSVAAAAGAGAGASAACDNSADAENKEGTREGRRGATVSSLARGEGTGECVSM